MKKLFILLALAFFTGCASAKYYVLPTAANPASITGSRVRTMFLRSDERVFPCSVDGTLIDDAEDYAERDLPLSPGRRVLQGCFSQGARTADADLVIDIAPGQKLRLVGRTLDRNFAGIPDEIGFQIVDMATGRALTPEIRKQVVTATPLIVPIPIVTR
jgi:hypothetical protein